jgi:hypothetical protein
VRARTSPRLRVARATLRWANLLLLAVLGAIAFEAILPLAWAIVRVRTLSLSPPFIVVVVLLTTSLLAYVVAEPIRIRRYQWRRMLWYPSTWLAIPMACGIAALAERLPAQFRPYSGSLVPDWQQVWLVVPIGGAAAVGLFLRQLPWRRARHVAVASSAGSADGFTWSDIEEWIAVGERPLMRGEKDLFQH